MRDTPHKQAPSVVSHFRVLLASNRRTDVHTDLRLISSRSRVHERHVKSFYISPLWFCESYFVVSTPREFLPLELLWFQWQSGGVLKRNWKRCKREPRAFVRDACVRAGHRETDEEVKTTYAENYAEHSRRFPLLQPPSFSFSRTESWQKQLFNCFWKMSLLQDFANKNNCEGMKLPCFDKAFTTKSTNSTFIHMHSCERFNCR